MVTAVLAIAGSALLVPFVGQDFFPSVDAGQIRLHVRAPAGTRLEETEQLVSSIERSIRRTLPRGDVALVLDNIGISANGINLAFSDNPTTGVGDADLLISLSEHRSIATADAVSRFRERLRREYPGTIFFFQSADIVGQILNFGLPAPIDVQVVGQNKLGNYAVARALAAKIGRVPGAVDVHVHQVMDSPDLLFNVDRVRAGAMGLTQRDVANDVLVALSSSAQVLPNYWVNPANGVNYPVAVQVPQTSLTNMEQLERTPIGSASDAGGTQLLQNVATVQRRSVMAVVSHYNVQPVFDVYANVQGRDLGGVAAQVDRLVGR